MKRPVPGRWIIGAVAAAAVISAARLGLLDPAVLSAAGSRLAVFGRDLFPPRLDILPQITQALLETIEIAFLGTLAGFIVSIPVAFLADRSLFGGFLPAAVRSLVGFVRTVPSIVYGVIFVVAFGLGPAAGVAAVACYTVGYLAKLYYEAFEAVDPEVVEAVRATGANRAQIFRFAVLPESANAIASQLLFMFEYNIRASTIMGFVGAGGVGYYMIGYVQMLQYRHLMTAILATFAVVMVIDAASARMRARLAGGGRPS